MRVQVVGKQMVKFIDKETGEKIDGIKLYVLGRNDNVDGLCASNIWIDATKPVLYRAADALSFANGTLNCDFDYQMQLGKPKPVLMDIKVLDQK